MLWPNWSIQQLLLLGRVCADPWSRWEPHLPSSSEETCTKIAEIPSFSCCSKWEREAPEFRKLVSAETCPAPTAPLIHLASTHSRSVPRRFTRWLTTAITFRQDGQPSPHLILLIEPPPQTPFGIIWRKAKALLGSHVLPRHSCKWPLWRPAALGVSRHR